MEEILKRLSQNKNKVYNFDFCVSENDFWNESQQELNYQLLSTSALTKKLHKFGYEILEEYLTKDMLSVVSKLEIKQYAPSIYNSNVFVKIYISDIIDNRVCFEGEVFDETELISKFKFVRIIISKYYLEGVIKNKKYISGL